MDNANTEIQKAFNDHSKIKKMAVYINDNKLVPDDIISFELTTSFFGIEQYAQLHINDSHEYFETLKIQTSPLIRVEIVDSTDKKIQKIFTIIDINYYPVNETKKSLTINMQDIFSSILSMTYISKSFNEGPIAAFKQLLEESLQKQTSTTDKIDDMLKKFYINNKIKIDSESGSYKDADNKACFVVPQDRTFYQFFLDYFNLFGIRMWQDNDSLNIGKNEIDQLPVLTNDAEDVLGYSNVSQIKNHPMYILDYNVQTRQEDKLTKALPKTKVFRFDHNKINNTNSVEISDAIKSIKFNAHNEKSGLDEIGNVYGEKYSLFSTTLKDTQTILTENMYIQNKTLEIFVNGSFLLNNVGQMIGVTIKRTGVLPKNETQNMEISGFFLITKVSHKIINNNYIAKLTLNSLS